MGLLRMTRVTTEQETLTAIPTRRPRPEANEENPGSRVSGVTVRRIGSVVLFCFFWGEGKI